MSAHRVTALVFAVASATALVSSVAFAGPVQVAVVDDGRGAVPVSAAPAVEPAPDAAESDDPNDRYIISPTVIIHCVVLDPTHIQTTRYGPPRDDMVRHKRLVSGLATAAHDVRPRPGLAPLRGQWPAFERSSVLQGDPGLVPALVATIPSSWSDL